MDDHEMQKEECKRFEKWIGLAGFVSVGAAVVIFLLIKLL